MSEYGVVLFDFDGVLSHGRFYSGLIKKQPETYQRIEAEIFAPPAQLAVDWMRGKKSSRDINLHLSNITGLPAVELEGYLRRSVENMELEKSLLDLARDLRSDGAKTGIVTDNMDIFTDITVPRQNLEKIFDVIVNSADYGYLKQDRNGYLFDVACRELKKEDFKDVLLVDDSKSNCRLFTDKGGEAILYQKESDLENMLTDRQCR